MCRIAPESRKVATEFVPQLIKQLETANVPGRRFAAEVLEEMGPAAEEAIAALSDATDDPDPVVRRAAAKALAAIRRELANSQPGPPGRKD
jgi:HEAT repeat protein